MLLLQPRTPSKVHLAGPHERPHRATLVFLKEDDHKKIQKEIDKDDKDQFLLTEEALRKFDILTGASELRQFACEPCKHPWWTYVPRTKPVSSCRICHVRYNALDRQKEFGLGRYICLPCDRTFYARCEATEMHTCLKCQKLTGPPYINPRFKPLPLMKITKLRNPPPRLHKIFNASTVHESTGSTVASFLTEDLGSDICVPVETVHTMATQDYYKPFEDDPRTVTPDLRFELAKEDDDTEVDQLSTFGEIGDLEESISFTSEDTDIISDTDSESGQVSRKRTEASDSSESDEDVDIDKISITSVTSVQGSEPDSGIGTWSNAGSGSDMGATSGSSSASECNYYVLYCLSCM